MTEPNIVEKWKSWAPYLKSILRIVAALMFITFGTLKLFAFPVGMPPDNGTAKFLSLAWIAGVLEVFGGALMLLGLFTRPVAFILAGEMAVAYFKAHFTLSPWPTENNGMAPALYSFLFLYLSFAGPGVWSVDLMIARAKWGRRLRERARQLQKGLLPERRRVAREVTPRTFGLRGTSPSPSPR